MASPSPTWSTSLGFAIGFSTTWRGHSRVLRNRPGARRTTAFPNIRMQSALGDKSERRLCPLRRGLSHPDATRGPLWDRAVARRELEVASGDGLRRPVKAGGPSMDLAIMRPNQRVHCVLASPLTCVSSTVTSTKCRAAQV
jgi:hypothetical protein